MLELPAVLVHAIQDFAFTDKPLWRISEGLQHVKVELTFKLPTDQPTCADRGKKPIMSKEAESRTKKPAPPAGEWPRQLQPAERPPICHSALPTEKPPTSHCALCQTAPPATVTIISPTAPTVNYQCTQTTKPSPTMPPAKKMPQREPSAPMPKKAKPA